MIYVLLIGNYDKIGVRNPLACTKRGGFMSDKLMRSVSNQQKNRTMVKRSTRTIFYGCSRPQSID